MNRYFCLHLHRLSLDFIIMIQKKVAIFTVGCKLNQYESEWMGESLEKYGFKRVDFSEKADIYLINTCTVTSQSDYSTRQAIYRAFRKSPDSRIVTVGCYSALEPEYLENLPGVSLVLGNEEKKSIGKIILERLYNEKPEIQEEKFRVEGRFKHTRALVKIQDGCNQTCAYCVVPKVRGREWSRNADEIVEEITGLRERGFKEVVLTGVHTGKYAYNSINLSALLQKILKESRIERVRLSSIEPGEIDDELIRIMAENSRVCSHFHIPLQSGSNRILSKMNREYRVEEYRNLVEKLSRKIEGISLGADVIAGFPGEKEDDFEKTCGFIQSIPLAYLHVFSYSDRKGTLASEMTDKISPQMIKKRSRILHQTGKEKWEKHLDSFIDREMEILVENNKDKNSNRLIGMTGNYMRVLIENKEDFKNRLLTIKVKERKDKYLVGEIIYG